MHRLQGFDVVPAIARHRSATEGSWGRKKWKSEEYSAASPTWLLYYAAPLRSGSRRGLRLDRIWLCGNPVKVRLLVSLERRRSMLSSERPFVFFKRSTGSITTATRGKDAKTISKSGQINTRWSKTVLSSMEYYTTDTISPRAKSKERKPCPAPENFVEARTQMKRQPRRYACRTHAAVAHINIMLEHMTKTPGA